MRFPGFLMISNCNTPWLPVFFMASSKQIDIHPGISSFCMSSSVFDFCGQEIHAAAIRCPTDVGNLRGIVDQSRAGALAARGGQQVDLGFVDGGIDLFLNGNVESNGLDILNGVQRGPDSAFRAVPELHRHTPDDNLSPKVGCAFSVCSPGQPQPAHKRLLRHPVTSVGRIAPVCSAMSTMDMPGLSADNHGCDRDQQKQTGNRTQHLFILFDYWRSE